jgi:hypothetical protein
MFSYKSAIFREKNVPGLKAVANDNICKVPQSAVGSFSPTHV